METQTEVQYVDPALLTPGANIRYGLRQSKIESLKASIMAQGRVMVPLEVEPLSEPAGGSEFSIIDGAYRHEAVTQLNKTGAGLLLPIQVVPTENTVDRAKRQLAFNVERADMSPMDLATAIKGLLNMEVPRIEIRQLFARPTGKKGAKTQPASNSFVNMMVSFLELPKPVQKKIHEGEIGVAGAYQLSKIQKTRPEKLQEVVAELEMARSKELEQEEKDEEKFLESIKKEEEAASKREALAKEAKDAEEAKAKIFDEFTALSKAEAAAHEAVLKTRTSDDKEAKENAEKAFKAAQEQTKAKLKEADEAKKAAEKLASKLETANKAAEERKNKLEEARKKGVAESKKKPAGEKEVAQAAKKVGAETNYVPLKLAEIRTLIYDGALPASQPKVQAIFQAIKECIDGVTIPKDCYKAIAKLTGEGKK